MMGDSNIKRFRDEAEEAEADLYLPEVKKLMEKLMDGADDEIDDTEFAATTSDLDSFMKSFEKEIAASPSASSGEVKSGIAAAPCSDSFGYLLEASDDDLGLPPPTLPGDREASDDRLKYEGKVSGSDLFGIGETEEECCFDGGGCEHAPVEDYFTINSNAFERKEEA